MIISKAENLDELSDLTGSSFTHIKEIASKSLEIITEVKAIKIKLMQLESNYDQEKVKNIFMKVFNKTEMPISVKEVRTCLESIEENRNIKFTIIGLKEESSDYTQDLFLRNKYHECDICDKNLLITVLTDVVKQHFV